MNVTIISTTNVDTATNKATRQIASVAGVGLKSPFIVARIMFMEAKLDPPHCRHNTGKPVFFGV